ncbi:MAG: VanZ family protein [Blautia sp.]|nr:VanZ family protein [Blautia sp.]
MAAGKTGKRYKTLWRILFAAYLILLFYFLFFSEGLGRRPMEGEYRYNLTLFREIRRYMEHHEQLGIKSVLLNVPGNVLAFLPFGFCWPLLWERRATGFVTTLCAFSLSLLVEITQLMFKLGSFDVDDLLLNTLGGFLGYLVCILCNKTKRKRTKKET